MIDPYIQALSVAGLNFGCFLWIKDWWRWISFSMAMAVLLFILASIYDRWDSGCLGAPKVTTFHQGMTLCPGQSAEIMYGVSVILPGKPGEILRYDAHGENPHWAKPSASPLKIEGKQK